MKYKLLAVVAVVAVVLPGVSLAQSQNVASLQAELQSLLAQVSVLEAQLGQTNGSTPTWCYTFNSNLSIGVAGSAVTALQTALQKDGETVTVNGTFDDQTAAAVTAFQEKYQSVVLAPFGLSNGTGYVGRGTRAELNALYGCGGGSTGIGITGNTSNTGSTGSTTGSTGGATPPIVVNPAPGSGSACPTIVPYCPDGGTVVVGSDGCNETICNAEPVETSTSQ